ncbi:MAG TPA: glycoside hydrolase family 2 TIM barrel-domain containing protein [bacterium]|nr:glycoside hydrolase family 2 TIM barrel-domain containing protein [bacterium]
MRFRAGFLFLFCGAFTMNLSAEIPKSEHPRPDWRRDAWQCLNGPWQFAFEEGQSGESLAWQNWPDTKVTSREIVVPFPWESRLSGIGEPDRRGTGWYFRRFEIPPDWRDKRIWLTVGAADFEATVWVNGMEAGKHEGGYNPFGFDITPLCRMDRENSLVIRVVDLLDASQPSGKQTGWYTPTSGIWQTVYLEARGPAYLEDATIRTDALKGTVSWSVKFGGEIKEPLYLEVAPEPDPEGLVTAPMFGEAQRYTVEKNELTFDLNVRAPRLWSPESPNLYFCRLTLKSDEQVLDTVRTYFGIRSVSRQALPGKDYEYIFLNGRPIYLIGALDQSFNPEGVYTFPNDAATRFDVEKALEFGFNFLRIHIKVEEPRFYYWADRLGLLIQQDMPNFNRYDDRARQLYTKMLDASMQRDMNHPCIFSWVLFNETWGLEKHDTRDSQDWIKSLYHSAKEMDPTRLIEDNSPCRYDHVITDINSWHFYIYDFDKAKKHIEDVVAKTFAGSDFNYIGGNKQGTEPMMNSEYGGISAGSGDRDISWCLHYLTTELRRHEKICGYIYTELQDIEWEHNGMMDYDRTPKDFGYEELIPVPEGQPPFSYRDIHNEDFLGIDLVPLEARKPGEPFNVTTWISRFSGKGDETLLISWRISGVNALGEVWRSAGVRTRTSAPHFAVTPLVNLEIGILPEDSMLYVLCVAAEDKDGKVVARNFAAFHTFTESAPRMQMGGKQCSLRWKPGDVATEIWNKKLQRFESGEKVFGEGAGRVEYQVNVPAEVVAAQPAEMEILVELGAHAGKAKIEWIQKHKETDYPQTEPDRRFPTDVTVLVNGVTVETVLIPDDPADVRGLLSNLSGKHPSSYGYLKRIQLSAEQVSKIFENKEGETELRIAFQVNENAAHKGGLSIYGEREGRYPVDPTLVIKTRNELK